MIEAMARELFQIMKERGVYPPDLEWEGLTEKSQARYYLAVSRIQLIQFRYIRNPEKFQ